MLTWKKIRLIGCVILSLILVWECTSINKLLNRQDEVIQEIQQNTITTKDNIYLMQINLLEKEKKELQEVIQVLQEKNQELKNDLVRIDSLIESNATIIQGVNRQQLRDIIQNTMKYLGVPNVKKTTDLLMLTAQIESDLGHYYRQVKGPAVGVFQIEPTTEKSIWNDYLKYRKPLAKKIESLRTKTKIGSNELEWNIAYSSALAHVLYRWRGVNPDTMTTAEMLEAYKKAFNTTKGKSTLHKSLKKIKGSQVIG